MPEAIIDTSALLEVLVGIAPDHTLRQQVLHHELAAPEILDLELVNVLRRLVRMRALHESEAQEVLRDYQHMWISLAPHRRLLDRVWSLRHSIRAYAAAYIALAEQLNIPLITCDGRLAQTQGHRAQITLFPA